MNEYLIPPKKPARIISKPVLTPLTLIFGFSMIVLRILQATVADFINAYFLWLAGFGMGLVFIIMIIVSLVHLPLQFKRNRLGAILPLVINLVTFLIIWLVPFGTIWLEWTFTANWEAYNEVVALIEEGEIAVPEDDDGLVLLPPEYRHLSKGSGEILVNKSDGVTRVFFFTFRGILDTFSGYMYRSDNNPPQERGFDEYLEEIIEKRPHWFYVVSN